MGAIIWALTVLTFWCFAIAGYVMNIVSILNTSFEPMTTLLVLRLIGIFVAPLGSALGLFA